MWIAGAVLIPNIRGIAVLRADMAAGQCPLRVIMERKAVFLAVPLILHDGTAAIRVVVTDVPSLFIRRHAIDSVIPSVLMPDRSCVPFIQDIRIVRQQITFVQGYAADLAPLRVLAGDGNIHGLQCPFRRCYRKYPLLIVRRRDDIRQQPPVVRVRLHMVHAPQEQRAKRRAAQHKCDQCKPCDAPAYILFHAPPSFSLS